jgi:hypothetical protein
LYPTVNTLMDDGYPKGPRNYWKSAFFKDLSEETAGILADRFRKTPSISAPEPRREREGCLPSPRT